MKRIALFTLLAASPALAQDQPDNGRLPSETACSAVLERVQIALAQADRALQTESNDDVERWSAIAANYATVHAAFCSVDAEE